MKYLIFGNPLVKEDSLPLKLISKLKQEFPSHEFIDTDPTENLEQHGKDLNIIDAELTTPDVREIFLETKEDFEKIKLNKLYSMHDFDLGYNLKLLKKVGKINTARIICIPIKCEEDQIFNQIQSILRK